MIYKSLSITNAMNKSLMAKVKVYIITIDIQYISLFHLFKLYIFALIITYNFPLVCCIRR